MIWRIPTVSTTFLKMKFHIFLPLKSFAGLIWNYENVFTILEIFFFYQNVVRLFFIKYISQSLFKKTDKYISHNFPKIFSRERRLIRVFFFMKTIPCFMSIRFLYTWKTGVKRWTYESFIILGTFSSPAKFEN